MISYDRLTDRGGRKVNEDFTGIVRVGAIHYFLLCDGLGGHGHGDAASSFVVGMMQTGLAAGWSIESSILNAQEALLEKQKREKKENSMKTTLTCLSVAEREARFAHVGDSRIYLFEKGKFKMRSQDHSVPQMLANSGAIREKDIRHHEDRSRILRVMGTEWDAPKYQISDPIALTKDTTFLLCSDGFWELIDEKQMGRTLKRAASPGEWLGMMEQIVIKNGQGTNMDNYSAIAVFIRG